MTIWQVVETPAEGTIAMVNFVCAPCAIDYYNEDREHRQAPQDVEPREGMPINQCSCEVAHPKQVAAKEDHGS